MNDFSFSKTFLLLLHVVLPLDVPRPTRLPPLPHTTPLPPKRIRSSTGAPRPPPVAAPAPATTESCRSFSSGRTGDSEFETAAARHHRHQRQPHAGSSYLATATSAYPPLAALGTTTVAPAWSVAFGSASSRRSFRLQRYHSGASSLTGINTGSRPFLGGSGSGRVSSSGGSKAATNAAATPPPPGEGASTSAAAGAAAPFPAVSRVDPAAAEKEAAVARLSNEGEWEKALEMLQTIRSVPFSFWFPVLETGEVLDCALLAALSCVMHSAEDETSRCSEELAFLP